jgi:hypothetical protein
MIRGIINADAIPDFFNPRRPATAQKIECA